MSELEEQEAKRDEREMGEGEDRGEETVTFRRLKEREKGEERV